MDVANRALAALYGGGAGVRRKNRGRLLLNLILLVSFDELLRRGDGEGVLVLALCGCQSTSLPPSARSSREGGAAVGDNRGCTRRRPPQRGHRRLQRNVSGAQRGVANG